MESTKTSSEKTTKKKRSLLSKLLRIFAWIIGSVIFLVILVLLLIQLPAVQNFGRKKIVSFLENKLHTEVRIGKLDIDFPSSLSLQNIYIEDQSGDTLLYGGKVKVDLKMLQLLSNNIQIEGIFLNNIVVKVKRLPPDSLFNFHFIADAFSSEETKVSETEDTATLKLDIDHIRVKNTRVVYKDAFTGNDMDLAIGDLETDIDKFDPTHLLFDIPSIRLDGLTGHFYQLEPLEQSIEKTVSEAAAEPESFLQLLNEEMKFANINVVFKSDPSHLYTSFIIGNLVIHPKTLDLKNSLIILKDATLDQSHVVVQTASLAADEVPEDTIITTAETPSFKIIAGKISINETSIDYDDQSAPHAPVGMDYAHLHLSDMNLIGTDILYSGDTIKATINEASLKEQSGFVLNEMTADFEMNPTGVSLENLLIKTPGSEIKRSAYITYPSLEALQENPGVLGLDINLIDSKITIKDLLTFVPALHKQTATLSPSATLYIDARITGNVNNMNFQKLILQGLSATDINVTGVIKGLPDPDRINADLNIKKFKTSRKDILSLLPKNTLPSNITLPETLSASGIFRGGMNNLYTDLTVNTSLGSAKVTGTLANITDENKARYDLSVKARNLQLKTLLGNPQLGLLTADIKVKGTGLDPKTANAVFDGTVANVTLNNYNYQNIKASGSIADKIYKINASILDPNVVAAINANGEFSGDFPAVQLDAIIDSIKTFPLHLTTSHIKYHGRVKGNFTNTDPNNLAGHLMVTNSILVTDGERATLDTLELTALNNGDIKSLSLQTDFLSAHLKGQYTLTQLGSVFQQAINPYFSLTETKDTVTVDPYQFSLELKAINSEALRAFVRELKEMKPVLLSANFSSDSGWNMLMQAPHILYGTMLIEDANITAGTKDGTLAFNTSIQQLKSGESVYLYTTTLNGTLKDDLANFILNIKDKESKDKYVLGGSLSRRELNEYIFSLDPEKLMLNYEQWSISPDNSIRYVNNDIIAKNFMLSQGSQHLSINSTTPGANSPLLIDFKNFRIATISGFIQQDSLLVNGLINGNALVKNISTQPVFTTDLIVNDLSIYNDTIGNLSAKVNNIIANTYHAVVNLSGRGNELTISGDYFVKPENSSFDFLVDIGAFQMKSLEGLTNGGIKDASGYLYGKIAINGNLNKPIVDGKIHFNNTAFNVSMLNNVFKIDNEAIAIINNEGIRLNTFTITDATENKLVVDGMINSKNFLDYSFDFTIRANNFQAINSTKKDNDLFYGKMVFSTRLKITGTPTNPVIDGDLTINDATDFTVVLPQDEPGIAQREGIVRFVDYSATPEDSLFMAPYDSLNVSPLTGYDVSINITISKGAVFNIIVDAGNGDFLRLKGTAQLTAGIDPSGKITLVGVYEIEEGSYDLSFNFIKRKFLIQEGSRIVWMGEPTSAQIDVTAVYEANTAPLDLVQGQIVGDADIYKQKLPFQVKLNMKGELLKPIISFNIVLPEEKNYNVSNDIISTVQARLVQLRQDPSEMNKQVFALLLLNRFVGQNPFQSSSGGSLDANTFARQSVSKLLTEQLNSLAEGLIEGVDINFDLATTEDYTTGSKELRTDFNVGISKRLLNDRLTVTVGSNFELDGPGQANQQQNNLAGNISINYKLSKDGKYALRAYRKNDYTGALEGYVVETGIGFIISVDFNKFKELFTSKESRREKRQIKRQNKKTENEKAKQEQSSENQPNPQSLNTKEDE